MKKILILAVIITGLLLCSGCPLAGWIAAMTPPAKIPAEYTIDKDAKILVLVEDPENIVTYSPVKYELARSVSNLLKSHDVGKDIIPPESVLHLKSRDINFNRLSTADIGKKLEADVVLYVRITEFKLKDSDFSSIWLGKMRVLVKLISVTEGRLWPKESLKGFSPQDVVTKRHESHEKNYAEKLSRKVSEEMAVNIAELFYEHSGKEHTELPEKDVVNMDQP